MMHFGYSAPVCIIDNTNLAVLRGTGKNAVMTPEMIGFAKAYGFKWQAHEVKHSDRKGGVERGFWFIETNQAKAVVRLGFCDCQKKFEL